MKADIVIVGAGPAGLCFARSLCEADLKVIVIDQRSDDELREPSFDGREIALTRKSVSILNQLDMWSRISELSKSRILDAKIFNGPSSHAIEIGHELGRHPELGWLVANQQIRKAAFEAVQCERERGADVEVWTGERVTAVDTSDDGATVQLESGKTMTANLIVAADGRFSTTRRMMGIPADMSDFGKSMLVCGMEHDAPHHHTAWEWFGYGQTLALLPMNSDPVSGAYRSSVVVTLPSRGIDRLVELEAPAFGSEIERRFDRRLGRMSLYTTRHAYPLVAVYPKRLVAKRFATIGDAAVGMHPVTAHGFNLGLSGVDSLAGLVRAAQSAGGNYAADAVLKRYESHHRLRTRPLYLATAAIANLYTQDHPLARMARDALVRVGERLVPFKRGIATYLAGGL